VEERFNDNTKLFIFHTYPQCIICAPMQRVYNFSKDENGEKEAPSS
jgi:hypothetical protein